MQKRDTKNWNFFNSSVTCQGCFNPLTPLLFLKNLKILNNFKNFVLSLNEDRALPGNLKAFVMLFLKHWCQFWWKSSGMVPRLEDSRFCVLRSLRVKVKLWSKQGSLNNQAKQWIKRINTSHRQMQTNADTKHCPELKHSKTVDKIFDENLKRC